MQGGEPPPRQPPQRRCWSATSEVARCVPARVHSGQGWLYRRTALPCPLLSAEQSQRHGLVSTVQCWLYSTCSLIPRPSPILFYWPHTWPLNLLEKWEKAWHNSYIIKLQVGLDNLDSVSVQIMATCHRPKAAVSYWVIVLLYGGGPPQTSNMNLLL